MTVSTQREKVLARGIDWHVIAESEEFKHMMAKKKRFTVSATIFFLIYYFALPILAGYSDILNTQVLGALNLAYVFALSQFIMAWVLAIVYVRHADNQDKLIEAIIQKTKGG
jgi:uncharacterized membrane protein (DUF485 family)